MFYLSKSIDIRKLSQSGCRQYLSAFSGAPGDGNQLSWGIYFMVMKTQLWRCTWRPWSSKVGNALGDLHWATLEAMMVCTARCTCRPKSSEFRDPLGGHQHVIIVLHLECFIMQVQCCTQGLWSGEFGDSLWMPRSSKIDGVLPGGSSRCGE